MAEARVDGPTTTDGQADERGRSRARAAGRYVFNSRIERLEEMANALTHGIGAGLAVAALVLMVVSAADVGSGIAVVSASIFGSSLIVCYLSSSLLHSVRSVRARSRLRLWVGTTAVT